MGGGCKGTETGVKGQVAQTDDCTGGTVAMTTSRPEHAVCVMQLFATM